MTDDPPRKSGPNPSPRASTRNEPQTREAQRRAGEALQLLCARVCDNLRHTMGADGCTALLARALARTINAHPCLALVQRRDGREIYLDGVAAALETYGYEATDSAITALLTTLVEILGRLIGEDMAMRIIDLGASRAERRMDST